MENTTIHGIASKGCPMCIILIDKLGKYSELDYIMHSPKVYMPAYNKFDTLSLNTNGVKNINNVLWSIPNLNPLELVRADILHNILLRVFEHMMD